MKNEIRIMEQWNSEVGYMLIVKNNHATYFKCYESSSVDINNVSKVKKDYEYRIDEVLNSGIKIEHFFDEKMKKFIGEK
jgi:hypothetical protein